MYVTDTVLYFLGFVTLVAVVYIIYAWVQIMTWWGDEEKIKKARQTIIYVITWIIFIWIAPWFIWVVLTAIN